MAKGFIPACKIRWTQDGGWIITPPAGNKLLMDGRLETQHELVARQRAFQPSTAQLDNHPFLGSLLTLQKFDALCTRMNGQVNSGHLSPIDSDDPGGSANGVWGDGQFVYLANQTDGLHVYRVNQAGLLTLVDSDNPGDSAFDVWGDGRFLYLANHDGGLHVYSVSDAGLLTHIDSDDQGNFAFAVWGDGRFVYLANHDGGLHVYTVSDAGVLTHIDSHNAGDSARGVWGDGRFVYLANDDGGLHVYGVSDGGILTHVDSDDQGDIARAVWGDGRFVYLANDDGGLHVYTVSEAGVLTHIDSDDQGDLAYGICGDGRFVYLANKTGGLHVYSVSDGGVLTHIDSDNPGNSANSVWCDDRFVYLANAGGGLHVYGLEAAYQYDPATEYHVFPIGVTWFYDTVYFRGEYGERFNIAQFSEEITIPVGQGSAGIVSGLNLLQDNSIIQGVVARVTQESGCGATWFTVYPTGVAADHLLHQCPDAPTGSTYTSAADSDGTHDGPWYNAADNTLTIITDLDVLNSDLKIRLTVFYSRLTPPTS